MALLVFPAVSFVVSLLLSAPLSRAFLRCRDHAGGRLPSGEGDHARAMMTRALWRRLRWWILFWSVAAVVFVYWVYPEQHGSGVVKPVGPFLRLAHAVACLLYFYGPLPYMLAACLHWTPRCTRWRSLFLWTHFGGWVGFALACGAVAVGLQTVFRRVDFDLPSGSYNPGFPDPASTLVYATALGVALACFLWFRFRRWAGGPAARGVAGPEGLQDS